MKLRFAAITVFFDSVETKWVPEAYLYRLGINSGFSDDLERYLQRIVLRNDLQSLIFFMFEYIWWQKSWFPAHQTDPLISCIFAREMGVMRCRKGDSDTYCYAFQDDGPTANTVLGAVWMKHQDGKCLSTWQLRKELSLECFRLGWLGCNKNQEMPSMPRDAKSFLSLDQKDPTGPLYGKFSKLSECWGDRVWFGQQEGRHCPSPLFDHPVFRETLQCSTWCV